MKALLNISKLVLIAGFAFSTLALKANSLNNTPGETKKATRATEKTIHDFFKFPGVLMPLHSISKPEEQKVEVLFTTDQNGNIDFVLAKTTRRDLKAEIERQFSKLHLSGLKRNVVHSVVLNFKAL